MDYFHEILTYLYNNAGQDKTVYINDFLINLLEDKKDNTDELGRVAQALNNLHSKTYILSGWIPILGRAGNGQNFNTLENNPNISTTLIHNGYVYISEWLRTKNQDKLALDQAKLSEQLAISILQTNNNVRDANISTIKTNNLLRGTNIIGVVVAALTCVFIALQYWKDDGLGPKSIDILLKQHRQILDSTRQIQKEIDSSRRTWERRDSSKKK